MTTILSVPGFASQLAVSNSSINPEQTERDVESWLRCSPVGEQIAQEVGFENGGFVEVFRNEVFNIRFIEIHGNSGEDVQVLEPVKVENYSGTELQSRHYHPLHFAK